MITLEQFRQRRQALITQMENQKLKVILEQVRRDVESGLSFSQGLAKHPDVFDGLYVGMIAAGRVLESVAG